MICSICTRSVPADAQFCIYCATRIRPPAPAVQPGPATGPTTRLDPAVVKTYTMPAPAPAAPQRAAPRRTSRQRPHGGSVGAVWLIGLGLLLLTGTIFPGVLALVGITSYMKESARGRHFKALQSLVFFLGLTTLFVFGFSWPGLFIWLGVMALLKHRP